MNNSNLELFVLDEYDIYICKIKYGYALHIKNIIAKTYDIYYLHQFKDIENIQEAVELAISFLKSKISTIKSTRLEITDLFCNGDI